jgi:hypothetical protein
MKSQSKIAASSAETSDVQSNEFQGVQSENGVGAITYFCVKTDKARKLGRNGGFITYKVLTDTDLQRVYITVVENDRGGAWSRDQVDFAAIERCLPADRAVPISAKVFIPSFKGRSANDPTFMAATLRSIGLLGPVENKPYLHAVIGDWAAWKEAMLRTDGVAYVPPSKAAKVPTTEPTAINGEELPAAPDAEEAVPVRKTRTLKLPKSAGGGKHARIA